MHKPFDVDSGCKWRFHSDTSTNSSYSVVSWSLNLVPSLWPMSPEYVLGLLELWSTGAHSQRCITQARHGWLHWQPKTFWVDTKLCNLLITGQFEAKSLQTSTVCFLNGERVWRVHFGRHWKVQKDPQSQVLPPWSCMCYSSERLKKTALVHSCCNCQSTSGESWGWVFQSSWNPTNKYQCDRIYTFPLMVQNLIIVIMCSAGLSICWIEACVCKLLQFIHNDTVVSCCINWDCA